MFSRDLINTDMLYQNDIVYLSNGLHDYMLNNFFVAFAMGVLFGVIIGLNAYLITDYIKKCIENKK
jgi:hypothetical protein